MRSRTGVHQPPTAGNRVVHGFPNVLVRMITHVLSLLMDHGTAHASEDYTKANARQGREWKPCEASRDRPLRAFDLLAEVNPAFGEPEPPGPNETLEPAVT